MTVTVSSLDAIVKELYDGPGLTEVVHDPSSRPLTADLKKDESFEGDLLAVPIFWGEQGGRSALFDVAQSTLEATELGQFQIDVGENYGVARITSKAMKKARSNRGAFVKGLQHTIDAKVNQVANDVEANLFRSSSGAIATIGTGGVSGTTITLSKPAEIAAIGKNQHLVFAASATATPRQSGTSAKVTSVNRVVGSFVIDATPTSTAAADLVFNKGDYVAASDKKKIYGLEDWIPAAVAGATAFFGVDRSEDTRLQGLYTTGSTSDIAGSIYEGAALLGRMGNAIPNRAYLSFDNFRKLNIQMGGKAERDKESGSAKAGYTSLAVYGPKGLIEVVAATFCQDTIVWLLTMDKLCLLSMGPVVDIFEDDGMRVQRISNAAGVEVRVESFAQLYTNMPCGHCRITLS